MSEVRDLVRSSAPPDKNPVGGRWLADSALLIDRRTRAVVETLTRSAR